MQFQTADVDQAGPDAHYANMADIARMLTQHTRELCMRAHRAEVIHVARVH
jgi:hypothetical protein